MTAAARKVRVKDRVANGLCPRCGEESAPYYLCGKHRLEARLIRALKRGTRKGGFIETRGTDNRPRYKIGDETKLDMRWQTQIVPPDNDGRFKPRIGRVPVDVERTLLKLLTAANKPCTIEEIMAAWGKLRTERKHDSVVGDMVAIIAAQRRRAERMAKRARVSFGTESDAPNSLQAVSAEESQE